MKLGIIGCGIIMQEVHLPALKKLNDRIKVVALCNRSKPKAEKTAELLGNSALPLYTDLAGYDPEGKRDGYRTDFSAYPAELSCQQGVH